MWNTLNNNNSIRKHTQTIIIKTSLVTYLGELEEQPVIWAIAKEKLEGSFKRQRLITAGITKGEYRKYQLGLSVMQLYSSSFNDITVGVPCCAHTTRIYGQAATRKKKAESALIVKKCCWIIKP